MISERWFYLKIKQNSQGINFIIIPQKVSETQQSLFIVKQQGSNTGKIDLCSQASQCVYKLMVDRHDKIGKHKTT